MTRQSHANKAAILFDMLAESDLTSSQIKVRTGWSQGTMMKAVQTLRDIFAEGDTISVVCEPQGQREAWLYGLRAGTAMMDEEASRWVPNRLQDSERRLKTIAHVLDVAARSLDGRTIPGRKSRIYDLHIRRALEEVRMLDLDDE